MELKKPLREPKDEEFNASLQCEEEITDLVRGRDMELILGCVYIPNAFSLTKYTQGFGIENCQIK